MAHRCAIALPYPRADPISPIWPIYSTSHFSMGATGSPPRSRTPQEPDDLCRRSVPTVVTSKVRLSRAALLADGKNTRRPAALSWRHKRTAMRAQQTTRVTPTRHARAHSVQQALSYHLGCTDPSGVLTPIRSQRHP